MIPLSGGEGGGREGAMRQEHKEGAAVGPTIKGWARGASFRRLVADACIPPVRGRETHYVVGGGDATIRCSGLDTREYCKATGGGRLSFSSRRISDMDWY